jgi:hypothetical protein
MATATILSMAMAVNELNNPGTEHLPQFIDDLHLGVEGI